MVDMHDIESEREKRQEELEEQQLRALQQAIAESNRS